MNVFANRRYLPLQIAFWVLPIAGVVWWATQQSAPTLPDTTGGFAELLGALAIYALATVARGERWHAILVAEGVEVSRTETQSLTVVGYMGNNALPARAGELLRVFLLHSRTGTSRRLVLGSILVERLLDAMALGILLVALAWKLADNLRAPSTALIIAGVAVRLLLIVIAGVTLLRSPDLRARLRHGIVPLLTPAKQLLSWRGVRAAHRLAGDLDHGGRRLHARGRGRGRAHRAPRRPVRRGLHEPLRADPRRARLHRHLRRRRPVRRQGRLQHGRQGRALLPAAAPLRAVRPDHHRRADRALRALRRAVAPARRPRASECPSSRSRPRGLGAVRRRRCIAAGAACLAAGIASAVAAATPAYDAVVLARLGTRARPRPPRHRRRAVVEAAARADRRAAVAARPARARRLDRALALRLGLRARARLRGRAAPRPARSRPASPAARWPSWRSCSPPPSAARPRWATPRGCSSRSCSPPCSPTCEGRPRLAVALGLVALLLRPEAAPFLAAYVPRARTGRPAAGRSRAGRHRGRRGAVDRAGVVGLGRAAARRHPRHPPRQRSRARRRRRRPRRPVAAPRLGARGRCGRRRAAPPARPPAARRRRVLDRRGRADGPARLRRQRRATRCPPRRCLAVSGGAAWGALLAALDVRMARARPDARGGVRRIARRARGGCAHAGPAGRRRNVRRRRPRARAALAPPRPCRRPPALDPGRAPGRARARRRPPPGWSAAATDGSSRASSSARWSPGISTSPRAAWAHVRARAARCCACSSGGAATTARRPATATGRSATWGPGRSCARVADPSRPDRSRPGAYSVPTVATAVASPRARLRAARRPAASRAAHLRPRRRAAALPDRARDMAPDARALEGLLDGRGPVGRHRLAPVHGHPERAAAGRLAAALLHAAARLDGRCSARPRRARTCCPRWPRWS